MPSAGPRQRPALFACTVGRIVVFRPVAGRNAAFRQFLPPAPLFRKKCPLIFSRPIFPPKKLPRNISRSIFPPRSYRVISSAQFFRPTAANFSRPIFLIPVIFSRLSSFPPVFPALSLPAIFSRHFFYSRAIKAVAQSGG